MIVDLDQKQLDRILNSTDTSGGEDACHPVMIGNPDISGYHRISINNKKYAVHRLIALLYQVDGNGPVVRHLCNNRQCANPKHLCYGSHSENYDDMREAGTATYTKPKMDLENANRLREEHESGCSQVQLSDKYGISRKQVKRIIDNEAWKTNEN